MGSSAQHGPDETLLPARVRADRRTNMGNEKWNSEERMPWSADYLAPVETVQRFRSPLADAGQNCALKYRAGGRGSKSES